MIFIGADHGGFELKEQIKEFLTELKLDFTDIGNTHYDKEDDYPDFAFKVAEKVAHTNSKGILVCRSAAGMVMAANKIKGIRAFAAFDEKSTEHARKHNNANIIALSGDWMDSDKANKILEVFLNTPFSNEERHIRRLKKIED